MIKHLQEKVSASGDSDVAGRVTALVIRATHLSRLTGDYGPARFDGAFSSFGPLNCEAHLAAVARTLGELVRPGGKVVISLLGRYCLWETAWYLLHGEPRQAFRRWNGLAEATVRENWQDERIPVFYWSAAQVERAFDADFSLLHRTALPWVLPPQYLTGIFKRRKRLFRLLAAIEVRTADVWPGNVIGDHIRFTFVRKK
jgi:SAM-dependent methyltransferase